MKRRQPVRGFAPARPLLSRRRATVLLMVVSLLALLFVIITGFLSLSRTARSTVDQFRRGDRIDAFVSEINKLIQELAIRDITDDQGRILAGPSAAYEQYPGRGKTRYIAPQEPVWDESVQATIADRTMPGNLHVLDQLKWPSVSSTETDPTAQPTPFAIGELMLDNELPTLNAPAFGIDEVRRSARDGLFDADA